MFEVRFHSLESSFSESQLILASVFPLNLHHNALCWFECDLIQVHGLPDLQLTAVNISAVQHYFTLVLVRRLQ